MHHLLEHINQDITRRSSKDKDSTVNKTEYRSKRNPTGKLLRARQTAKVERDIGIQLGDNVFKFFIWGGISSDIRSEI